MSNSNSPARTRCEVWTRVMGYHRPVSHFNIGKKSEHYSRKHFTALAAANSSFAQKYSLFAVALPVRPTAYSLQSTH